MAANKTGRLVILSGPSCVGKSPLKTALARFHPTLSDRLTTLVLFNSRAPRPGERDGVTYHFRSKVHIDALKSQHRYAVLDVRGDLQALDLEELTELLGRSDAFFEGNPFVGRLLQTHPLLAHVDRLSMFLSPLSQEEIRYLKAPERHISLPEFVTDIMRRKLLRRARRQKGELSLPDLENIETRARSAYRELTDAWRFQHVIPNHDGEDSDNWEAFYYPIGDARKSLVAVVALLERVGAPPGVETWGEDLLPPAASDGTTARS
jgi:guanylate kinase